MSEFVIASYLVAAKKRLNGYHQSAGNSEFKVQHILGYYQPTVNSDFTLNCSKQSSRNSHSVKTSLLACSVCGTYTCKVRTKNGKSRLCKLRRSCLRYSLFGLHSVQAPLEAKSSRP